MSTNNICFYGELRKLPFSYHQIPSLSVFLSIADQQRYLMMMDSIMDKSEGQPSTSPFGLGSQLLGVPKATAPTLPPPPRVEPRVNVPK